MMSPFAPIQALSGEDPSLHLQLVRFDPKTGKPFMSGCRQFIDVCLCRDQFIGQQPFRHGDAYFSRQVIIAGAAIADMTVDGNSIWFQRLTNYGAYTESAFAKADVTSPSHPMHRELLDILRSPLMSHPTLDVDMTIEKGEPAR